MNRARMSLLLHCCLAASLLLPPAVAAQADAVVEAVQLPAWVERQGGPQALVSGFILQNRDRVMTGPQGRVRIRLGDGSTLAMAADTQLDLNALGVREKEVFTAALDVQQGAVRFTTAALARDQHQRAINLRVGTITAGIRGTDVWGRADGEGDRICLLEGNITVLHPLDEARRISEALDCYVAPKGTAPTAIEAFSPGRVAWWAAQTGMPTASPTATPTAMPGSRYQAARKGGWAVELATLDSEAAALSLYDRARAAGYPVRIKPQAATAGSFVYTVRLTPLPSQDAATALAAEIGQSLQLASPVVARH